MNKKTKTKNQKRKMKNMETSTRGRPPKPVKFPTRKFTVNDMVALNPDIACRLSLYTKVKKAIAAGKIRKTGETVQTGGVGKPLIQYQPMANYRISRSQKRISKLRKLTKASVNLTVARTPIKAAPVAVAPVATVVDAPVAVAPVAVAPVAPLPSPNAAETSVATKAANLADVAVEVAEVAIEVASVASEVADVAEQAEVEKGELVAA